MEQNNNHVESNDNNNNKRQKTHEKEVYYLYESKATVVDLASYKRRKMYEIFKDRQVPVFSITSRLNITKFKKTIGEKKLRFFASLSYVISCTCNEIKELRHRIVDGKIIEFDIIHPGMTMLKNGDELCFTKSRFSYDFQTFYKDCIEAIDAVNTVNKVVGTSSNDRDNEAKKLNENAANLFFITSNHWIDFTSFTHPYDPHNGSNPIITVGKFTQSEHQQPAIQIPIAIQVNHGVVDGFHAGLFFETLQKRLDDFNG